VEAEPHSRDGSTLGLTAGRQSGKLSTMTTNTTQQLGVIPTILGQIGRMNILAISGGRLIYGANGRMVALPVSNGYRVEVEYLPASDTYEVRRVFLRAGRRFDKGTATHVHAAELGEMAYQASCFRDGEFGGAA
jgi:hypothetical protein